MIIMSQLGPKASALVKAGRGAQRPTAADRERIGQALASRLGATALAPESGDASPPLDASPPVGAASPASALPAGASGVGLWLVSGVIVALGVLGAVLYAAGRAEPWPAASQQPSSPPLAAPAVVPPAPQVEPQKTSPTVPTLPTTESAELPVPSARPKQDRLAQEVLLLTRATTDLNAGRAALALKVLDEHQRKFPGGLLTEERRAARAQALCELGRVSEAQADLARLAPRSPAVARAKQVCAARSAPGKR